MSAKIAWTLVAILIVGGGAYVYLKGMPPTQGAMMAPADDRVAAGSQAAANGTSDTGGAEMRDPMMTGTWKSDQDAKFTREFRADGVIVDSYAGDASAGMGGSWKVIDPLTVKIGNVPSASLTGMTVVEATWNDGADKTYFSINSLTETSLKITDLSGTGKVMTFTKVK